MRGRILPVIIAFAAFFNGASAFAEVLGERTDGWETDMGASTTYHHNTFVSPSVGKQSETYIEYTPNENAKPVVVNGASVWGTRSINGAASYMYDTGRRPLAGINADYFSFTTGIPMGNTIIDGEIVSAENMGQDAIAFDAGGRAFIDWIDIKTIVSDGERSAEIDCINKWYQASYDTIFLLNDKFGSSTHTDCECLFVICSPVEGRLAIGQTASYRVDDSFVYEGNIEIPEGKAVLMIATGGDENDFDFMRSLQKGQTITVTDETENAEKWSKAEQLVSSVGGRIIMNGEVRDVTDRQAAPRTAVGVRDDGSAVFYTLDGRQPGYSYGAQIETVAERLAEMGCTEAINLDGGGSTSIGGVFPGTDGFLVTNSPSEGELRNVANFLFIRDDRKRTDIPWIINAEESGGLYMSGMTATLNVDSVYDTANYKIENPSVSFEIKNSGGAQCEIDESGVISFKGEGTAVASAVSGGARADREFAVYETPEEIRVYNSEDWKEIEAIYTEANEELQLNLAAAAFTGGVEIKSDDRLFEWSADAEIGTVNDEGIFTLADTVNKKGKITVRAGNLIKEIPVEISDYPRINPFADTAGHWAEDIISETAGYGILKGVEENGAMYFYPDRNMTRAEFASMICNYRGIDPALYGDASADFADYGSIQPWARGCVKAMYAEGLMNGRSTPSGTVEFAPEDGITRAEAMTILYRMTGEGGEEELTFADSADIPDWARSGVGALTASGIVNGYEDGTIRPNSNVTRAEAAAMVLKIKTADAAEE